MNKDHTRHSLRTTFNTSCCSLYIFDYIAGKNVYLMLDITFWLYKGFMDYHITFSKNMNVLYNFLIVLFGSGHKV